MLHQTVCILFLLCIGPVCRGLRMVLVGVPPSAARGTGVSLACSFELTEEQLYSVKWYKDELEFYRFVPEDWPPAQFLPLPGVNVDLSRSGERNVFLRSVNASSAGEYRCEVSAEGPDFRSVHAKGTLSILDVPAEGPRISGTKGEYAIGDTVALNCTSPPSGPEPKIQWFVNDRQMVGEPWSEDMHQVRGSSLEFVARDKYFDDDRRMRIRCEVNIAPIYARSDETMAKMLIPTEKPISRSGSNAKRKAAKHLPSTSGVDVFTSVNWLLWIAPLVLCIS